MKTSFLIRIIALMATAAVASVPAQAASLKIGDPAPALQVGKWVQGEPVAGFDSNHVYIVEFWATWCVPCKASIPHLNEIWEKFKDRNLIVIGQDCQEDDGDKVAGFVKKMGANMTYRVTLDDKRKEAGGAMLVTWLKAADMNGIPTAFLINHQGKIAWIGHPLDLKDAILEDVLADKFDAAAFAREFEKDQPEQKARQARQMKFIGALNNKNWDAAETLLNEIEQAEPEGDRDQLDPIRIEIFLGRQDYSSAAKLATTLYTKHKDDAALQSNVAWELSSRKGATREILTLAETIARHAFETVDGTNAYTLDVLARVQFLNGKTNEAVATEQKAAAVANGEIKTTVVKNLENYSKGVGPELQD